MRLSLRSVLAGGAAILTAACLTPAMAENRQVHVMTVQLPGGGVEQIRFTGDVAPRVVLVPAPALVAVPEMTADPFAMLYRISAMMDQQAAEMLQQVRALTDAPQGVMPGLPPGASGYAFVSTMSGNGVCTRSVRITYSGGNAAPQTVSSTSGDCGHAGQAPSEVTAPDPAIRYAPHTIEVRATGPAAGGAPLRQVAWSR